MSVKAPLSDIMVRRGNRRLGPATDVSKSANGKGRPPLDVACVLPKRHMPGSREISCAARSQNGYAFDAATARLRWLCSNTRNINPCVMSSSGTIAVGMK
jgi:hypothetical protein